MKNLDSTDYILQHVFWLVHEKYISTIQNPLSRMVSQMHFRQLLGIKATSIWSYFYNICTCGTFSDLNLIKDFSFSD